MGVLHRPREDPAGGERLRQNLDGWRRAGHDAEPTAVAAAIEALSSLRAEAALHTGPPRPNEGLSEPALTVTIEPSAGHGAPRVFRIGSGDNYEDRSVRYGRAGSIDATYVIADSKLRPLFDLL